MENKFLNDFIEHDYNPLADQFLKQTVQYLGEVHEPMYQALIDALKSFCYKLSFLQKQVPIAAGTIQISLLHTSIYFGTPKIRLDAYDEAGVLGASILNEEVEFPWLFHYWEEWKAELLQAVKTKHYECYIGEERIRILMCEKVKLLLYMLYVHVKYPMEQLDQYSWLQEIEKTPEFTISIGEYEDWQKTVYGEVPFIDMFLNLKEESLQFQKYEQLVFKDKTFDNLDLSKVRFTDCHFIESKVRNTVFYDVNMLGCRFHNVVFENCKFYGSHWEDCFIQKTSFIHCSWWKDVTDFEEPVEDIYRVTVMESCSFNRVVMQDCDLKNLKVTDEHMKDVEIKEVDTGGENQ